MEHDFITQINYQSELPRRNHTQLSALEIYISHVIPLRQRDTTQLVTCNFGDMEALHFSTMIPRYNETSLRWTLWASSRHKEMQRGNIWIIKAQFSCKVTVLQMDPIADITEAPCREPLPTYCRCPHICTSAYWWAGTLVNNQHQ